MARKNATRWKDALCKIANYVGEYGAYCINNDRITAKRADKVADQLEEIAMQIESWFGEECNDNGFRGSCGCSRCLSTRTPEDTQILEF